MRGFRAVETAGQDLRYGLRMLRRSPGFTAAAVVTLALGIGANTAIFSVVNAVLLRPLPFPDAEQLVMVWESSARAGGEISVRPINFLAWREQNQVCSQMAAFQHRGFSYSGGGAPERLQGVAVSADMFPLLGVRPLLGRTFLPAEDRPGGGRVVLVSYEFWRDRLGSDARVTGRPLRLNGETHEVIGVLPENCEIVRGGDMPRGFEFAARTDLWVPLAPRPDEVARHLHVLARLKPGVTPARAEAEISQLARRLDRPGSPAGSEESVKVTPLAEQLVRKTRPALLALLGAVLLVLLVACANIAHLLLARAASRRREIAVRTALGAGRRRVIRQLLTESLLLAALGSAAGLLLAAWSVKLLVAFSPADLPRMKEVTVDARVLGLTCLLSCLAGVVCGLAPALQASRPDVREALQDGGRGAGGGAGAARLRGLLVSAEVALSLVLLVCAALLLNSLARLQGVNPGFDPEHTLTMQLALPEPKYPAAQGMETFHRQVLERVGRLPGVAAAGVVSWLPLGGRDSDFPPIEVAGRPPQRAGEPLANSAVAISPDYFRAMGIPMLRGRTFTAADAGEGVGAIIINETLARRHWPAADPVGSRITVLNNALTFNVVGVVADVRHAGLEREPNARVYLPYTQIPPRVRALHLRAMTLVLRSAADPTALVAAVRDEVRAVDAEQPISNIKTMRQVTSDSVAPRRFTTALLAAFAAAALALAAVGLYGVVAYGVSLRRHEIGVRMALGAQRGDVLRLVLGQGLRPVVVGLVAGLLAAWAVTPLLASMLYGVGRADPATFAGVALMLALVAALAGYLAARRATRVDPAVALRQE